MPFNKKQINTVSSLIIITVWFTVIFLIAFPSLNAPTKYFGVVIYCILTLLFGIIIGVISIIARCVKNWNFKNRLFYNFSGTLNMSLGFLGTLLFVTGNLTEIIYILLFILSLIIGVFIHSDIYSKNMICKF